MPKFLAFILVKALVLNSGYFGDSFADWYDFDTSLSSLASNDICFFVSLETYGAKVTQIKAPIGAAVTEAQIEK
jgi:alanine-glyoxylate transaminase/serine-glyoxylate transaminase/serine-pyruvate transaminase